MKSVLISIQPKWCELIALGKKTVEVRKTRPKIETPFKVYIYATKREALWKIRKRPLLLVPTYDNRQYVAENEYFSSDEVQGKVIGEFVCDEIYELHDWHLDPRGAYQEIEEENLKKLLKMSQLTYVIEYDLLLAAFICEDDGTMYFTTFDGDSKFFEIIGNIHDNPELLKGE